MAQKEIKSVERGGGPDSKERDAGPGAGAGPGTGAGSAGRSESKAGAAAAAGARFMFMHCSVCGAGLTATSFLCAVHSHRSDRHCTSNCWPPAAPS